MCIKIKEKLFRNKYYHFNKNPILNNNLNDGPKSKNIK